MYLDTCMNTWTGINVIVKEIDQGKLQINPGSILSRVNLMFAI